jgi:hypothetical protein
MEKNMKHIFWFQHRYLPVGVNEGTGDVQSTLNLRTVARNVPMTLVLFKCKCGKVKTKVIEGKWTLDQVRDKFLDIVKDKI